MKTKDGSKENKPRIGRAQIVWIILTAVTLGFIWIHSMMSREVSTGESSRVFEWLYPFFRLFLPEEYVTDFLIRKIAHFVEFAALGLELRFLLRVFNRESFRLKVNAAFSGMLVAVIDETIQIFSNRGSKLADVWLDFAGCVCGMLVAGLISRLIKK